MLRPPDHCGPRRARDFWAWWAGGHRITRFAGSADSPCYTPLFLSMFNAAAQRCAALAAVLLLGINSLAPQETSSPWPPAADDFVHQILARAGSPSAISLTFANLSSLSAGDQATIKQIITTDFHNAGVRLVKADSSQSEVEITFSEDWQSYVWAAEIKQGPVSQVVISKVPRPQSAASSPTPTLTIKKNLVWQQEGAILDFYWDGQNLFVLEPSQISLYVNEAGKWRGKQAMAITHDRPWPRDLRGRLLISGFQVSAFLPGTLCTGTATPPAVECRASDDPWSIDSLSLAAFFSPSRNFFTGVLAGHSAGESVPPFFSAAATQSGSSRQWVFAGTDGRARVFLNNTSTAAMVVNDWGSNLTAVQSSCGRGWQILATAPGDLNRMDSVQAFEIEGHQTVPVSSVADLDGPILAFWAGENPQIAHAIVQSPRTGKFEAWSITVACN